MFGAIANFDVEGSLVDPNGTRAKPRSYPVQEDTIGRPKTSILAQRYLKEAAIAGWWIVLAAYYQDGVRRALQAE
jgi:hypothetical protein